jgi:hypothetical protein
MDGLYSSITTRLEQALGLTLAESDRVHAERERLREETVRLARELNRLAQENDALRESAEIWIRMYENQLARANEAVRALAACAERKAEAEGGTLPAQTPAAGTPRA